MAIVLDGEVIRGAREARGLSQTDLARKSHLSRDTVARAERSLPIQPATLTCLAHALARPSHTLLAPGSQFQPELDFSYDVAFSYAREERARAEDLATCMRAGGYRVFYDLFEQHSLWGSDLVRRLSHVYEHESQHCIVIISEAYARRVWTRHELNAALRRALRGPNDYILPLRLDDTDLIDLPSTTGYLDLRVLTNEDVYECFDRKMRLSRELAA